MELYNDGWYHDLAVGQTVERLNLQAAPDAARLDALLAEADLLITATRPAGLERLGLGWDALHEKYPRLCQVAIVGHPSPRRNEPGHDLTYQAALGLINPPSMPRTLLADMAGAEQATAAALALLLGRERGKPAGYAEVALSDAAAAMAEPLTYGCTATGAILGGGIPEYNLYRAREGWVAVAALEPHFRKRIEKALGVVSTVEEYQTAFAAKSAAEWQEWGQQLDIPIVAVKADKKKG